MLSSIVTFAIVKVYVITTMIIIVDVVVVGTVVEAFAIALCVLLAQR